MMTHRFRLQYRGEQICPKLWRDCLRNSNWSWQLSRSCRSCSEIGATPLFKPAKPSPRNTHATFLTRVADPSANPQNTRRQCPHLHSVTDHRGYPKWRRCSSGQFLVHNDVRERCCLSFSFAALDLTLRGRTVKRAFLWVGANKARAIMLLIWTATIPTVNFRRRVDHLECKCIVTGQEVINVPMLKGNQSGIPISNWSSLVSLLVKLAYFDLCAAF